MLTDNESEIYVIVKNSLIQRFMSILKVSFIEIRYYISGIIKLIYLYIPLIL